MQATKRSVLQRNFLLLFLLLLISFVQAQESSNKSDTFFLAKKKGLLGKLGQSIAVNSSPNTDSSLLSVVKNIDPYIIYKGNIIRNIIIRKVNYGQSVNDTSKTFEGFLSRLGDNLHVSTTEKTIRNDLFFKSGDSLLPYLMADNDRFLRTNPYLQDARISIHEVMSDDSNIDSVDVIVYYKDVFPISGAITTESSSSLYLQGTDDNFRGRGDRIVMQTVYDYNRQPKTGFGIEYTKRNIKGSFVDFTVGYQNMNPTFNSGRREETAVYTKLTLPLVSPYYLWTGEIQTSLHYTQNNYLYDTTSYFLSDFNYRYTSTDAWVGYNISAKNLLHETIKRKNREFLAVRLINTNFTQIPSKYTSLYNYLYANQTSILSAYTVFKQDYYRTSFIYGFGRNEDVPEGFNYSAIAGWTNKFQYVRPYVGVDLQRNYFNKRKDYYNFELKAGGYLNQGSFQDISLLASLETFTRLRRIHNTKWLTRHFITGSITQQLNTFLNEPLVLNSGYGIPQFVNPDTTAATRITINSQSVFYNTHSFLGFRFAPFTVASFCYLKPIGESITEGDGYIAIGGGARTRNENLVFGTIELKFLYFPRVPNNMNQFNLTLTSDLSFRYNSQFIKRPDFVVVN